MKTEIQIITKKATILKCSLFLFMLSMVLCAIENIEWSMIAKNIFHI
ncbi:MAG: hypothetical protein IPP64_07690 [Bacteroidetes bacterium]|nr:hypothetical protein [Bacteroidota bacterium]